MLECDHEVPGLRDDVGRLAHYECGPKRFELPSDQDVAFAWTAARGQR